MNYLQKTINRVFILLSLSMAVFINAQNITGKSSKISVSGTSPMHDWTMTANTSVFTGTVANNSITNAKFIFTAKNLKSTKGKMMDNKAYKALKADVNPNITFTATSLPFGKSNVTGKLSIAGVTKTVTLPINIIKTGESYQITGSESLKMSDFGMETPGFLGVHTGDAVTVTVNIVAN